MSERYERYELNKNLAQMLKGGVIMDVTTPEPGEDRGSGGRRCGPALERTPADTARRAVCPG